MPDEPAAPPPETSITVKLPPAAPPPVIQQPNVPNAAGDRVQWPWGAAAVAFVAVLGAVLALVTSRGTPPAEPERRTAVNPPARVEPRIEANADVIDALNAWAAPPARPLSPDV